MPSDVPHKSHDKDIQKTEVQNKVTYWKEVKVAVISATREE
jgi:hypothetical protein